MIDQLLDLIHAATAIVASASAICAVTPTPKDDTVIAKAYAVLEFLAINIGKAKRVNDEKALNELRTHEKECLLRYENIASTITQIEKRLDKGSEKMSFLQNSILALYPWVLAVLLASNLLEQIMFGLGELAAVVSAIKGVQSLLNGLSDAKASYDQASQLLGQSELGSDLR